MASHIEAPYIFAFLILTSHEFRSTISHATKMLISSLIMAIISSISIKWKYSPSKNIEIYLNTEVISMINIIITIFLKNGSSIGICSEKLSKK